MITYVTLSQIASPLSDDNLCNPLSGDQSAASVVSDTDVPHVMLSYPWCYQRVIVRVKDQLRAAGFKVWMDVDNMSEYQTSNNQQQL